MTRFIESIQIQNLLSFGPNTEPLELGDLNVLIGPNGSGKSNFVDIINLLKGMTDDLQKSLTLLGGRNNILWDKNIDSSSILCTYNLVRYIIAYRITIGESWTSYGSDVYDESIKSIKGEVFYENVSMDTYKIYNLKGEELPLDPLDPSNSVLAQIKGPTEPFVIGHLSRKLSSIYVYSQWPLGRHTEMRLPQPSDLKNKFVDEDNYKNLVLVLNKLYNNISVKKEFDAYIKLIYNGAIGLSFLVEGGTIQFFLEENGRYISSSRLSDGTFRFLFLLATLLNPSPPPLICIEEPELGLHPDLISTIGELLIKASKRTQIIVTTHSSILIDALSHVPESIVVCEKNNGATQLTRLDSEEMSVWLEKYRLGELWTSGQIGGNRW